MAGFASTTLGPHAGAFVRDLRWRCDIARPSQLELHQRLRVERLAHIASRHRGRCHQALWLRALHCPVDESAVIPQLSRLEGWRRDPAAAWALWSWRRSARCRVLAGQLRALEFLEAADQPGLARRRCRPASLARVREWERHVDVSRDAWPAHEDGRDRSHDVSRTAVLRRGPWCARDL